MKLRSILTSFTFRFMLLYVTALSVAVFVIMAIIYGAFTYNYFDELQEAVVDELSTIELVYAGQGLTGVEQYLRDSAAGEGRRFQYLLTDGDYKKLAGTLDSWPEFREIGDGWIAFGRNLTSFDGEADLALMGRPLTLDDGSHLLAALRYGEVWESARQVFETLVRTMIATILLGIVGGFFAAASVLRRIEVINEGIDKIVHGDFSQRIPVGDSVGNVRLLIENFNGMLDQTESLMQGVRTVSDNIAHDLRTPLTRIRNSLSQLSQSEQSHSDVEINAIIDECDGLLKTFNALLRIAQLEAGNRIQVFTRIDMSALVSDVVDLYEPLAQEKAIDLSLQSATGVHCDGDRDLVFQMLANLIDNAVKYTPEGGRIYVELWMDTQGYPGLAVSDTGPGVPETDRENVFQRFFRLETSRSQHPGNGLGLSLVKAVVKLHRGVIRLLDNQPGLRVEVRLG